MFVVTHAAAEDGRQAVELPRGEDTERSGPPAIANVPGIRDNPDALPEPSVDDQATYPCARFRTINVVGANRKRRAGDRPSGVIDCLRNIRDDLDHDLDAGPSVDPIQ